VRFREKIQTLLRKIKGENKMQDREIDYKKDHLVIWKRNRKFNNFRWYWGDNFTKEKIEKQVAEYNSHKNRIDDGIVAEYINDPLIREICAYKIKVEPLEDILNEVKELQESLENVKDSFLSVLSDISQIGGFE
jgi:hypothetical protein